MTGRPGTGWPDCRENWVGYYDSEDAERKISITGRQQPVGLEETGCKSVRPGSYFAAFSANRITIGLQNPQGVSSPSHFFPAILQIRQAPAFQPVQIFREFVPMPFG
jgi:hypothetical protein